MISWILAAVAFYVGARAFTQSGMRLTANKTLHGAPAKTCGAVCILLGLFLVWDGFLGMSNVVRIFSD